ncbi:MAG TPA: hypothetical protein VI685_15170 [Candidatus Angelobacter sp.]
MAFILIESQDLSTWTKVQVIADAGAAIGIVFTLFYSLWSFTTALRDGYYAELDRVYFELLKITLERPYLLDFPSTPDPQKQREYDAYAFMVWNFVETVFDRCQGWGKRSLRATWYPVIEAENALHRQWFDVPANRSKFKQHFCRFIERQYPSKAIKN